VDQYLSYPKFQLMTSKHLTHFTSYPLRPTSREVGQSEVKNMTHGIRSYVKECNCLNLDSHLELHK